MDAPWPWRPALARLEKESSVKFKDDAGRIKAFQKVLCAVLPQPPDAKGPELNAWVECMFHFDAFEATVPKAWSAKTQRRCMISSFRTFNAVEASGPTGTLATWVATRTKLEGMALTAKSKAPLCMYPMLEVLAARLARSCAHAEFPRTNFAGLFVINIRSKFLTDFSVPECAPI